MAELKERETRSKIEAIANRMGAVVAYDSSRVHRRVIVKKGCRSRFVVYASSSRSTSGLRNFLATLKRTIQSMEKEL